MKKQPTTLEGTVSGSEKAPTEIEERPALVLIWAANEPERVGEVLMPPSRHAVPFVFGRGEDDPEDRYERVRFVRQRPGENVQTAHVEDPFLSRQQLKMTPSADGLRVENVGKRPLLVDDEPTNAADVVPGQTLEIRNLFVFLCVMRRVDIPRGESLRDRDPRFGAADASGVVGESPLVWALRERLAFIGARQAHVLITGESGTGKELAAGAIHAQSQRRGKKLVARNAATFPAGLIDAELFGNVANYPNAGMPERPGLVGEADGSTLFLDEIGELPVDLQTHLLRVLDEGGDYQRLGESKRRSADIRLIGATNRPVDQLKHDLAARLALRVEMPGLNERREDVPLLARHLLRRLAKRDPELGARFFEGDMPRATAPLIRALTLHEYTTHVRELDKLLWSALSSSTGKTIDLTDEVRAQLGPTRVIERVSVTPATEVSAEAVRAAMDKHGGVQERVWRELGLSSRHALHRLLKKYGLTGK